MKLVLLHDYVQYDLCIQVHQLFCIKLFSITLFDAYKSCIEMQEMALINFFILSLEGS